MSTTATDPLDTIRPDSISATPGSVEAVIVVNFTSARDTDPVVSVRRMLKHAKRVCSLRCTSIEAIGWPGVGPLPKNPSAET